MMVNLATAPFPLVSSAEHVTEVCRAGRRLPTSAGRTPGSHRRRCSMPWPS